MLRKIINFICFVFFINFFLYSTTLLSVEAKGASKNNIKNRIRIVKMTKEDIKHLGEELDHPGELDIAEIKNALTAIYYKKKIMIRWSRKKPVFGKKTSTFFAPLIQRALQKVKPNYKVSFLKYNSNGKTTGDVFAKNDTLIFKFEIINGSPYRGDDFDLKTEIEKDKVTNWKLIPGSNQQFYLEKGFFGLPVKSKTMIETKLKKSKYTREKNKNPEHPDKQRILEGKLRYLKDLKKQNLITEDAYKKKVEELLDQM